jgi:NAD(P)-dependent dehydrogenase (short-subunit alcohol dehydrogenase family)
MSSPSSHPLTILITGATRGLGLAMASLLSPLLAPHSTLLIGCRSLSTGQAIASRFPNAAPLLLDVSSDASITSAASHVRSTYGHLDILINNAGGATPAQTPNLRDLRHSFQATLDLNVASVALVTLAFLPLLRLSAAGAKVIALSSGRASMARNADGQMPPSRVLAYTVSKAALNMLMLDLARGEGNGAIEFQLASPGHCSTGLNGFRGERDPLEGARVVVELALGGRRETGFWEKVGEGKELVRVPW